MLGMLLVVAAKVDEVCFRSADRLVSKRARLHLKTLGDSLVVAEKVEALALAKGGVVATSVRKRGSGDGIYGAGRQATLSLRVPADSFDDVVAALGALDAVRVSKQSMTAVDLTG